MPKDLEAYMNLMRSRFESARKGWSAVREDFRDDLRYVCGDPELQWDPIIKSNRDDDGIPALTMDRLNALASSIANRSKKDRPQPKVEAGDDGDPATAEVIEGKLRHLLYISHSNVAFDCAETYCTIGGIGYVKWVKDYTSKRSVNQEPRIKRVPDPMSEYPDPGVEEADFSDAKWWFSRKRYPRNEFSRDFTAEPMPFPFPEGADPSLESWGDDEYVWVAEYFWVEEIDHEFHVLADGRNGIAEDLMEEQPYTENDVVSARPAKERIVHCDIVDGEKILEESIWEGEWIPRCAVTGPERIHEGRRRFLSAIRYARDPQSFLNVAMSDMADRMATVNKAPFIGPKGAFKDKKWRDGKRHFYLEWEPKDSSGQPIPAGSVERAQYEANIQADSAAAMLAGDAIKGAMGYVDTINRPSQADLSAVAVQKRDDQVDMANMHFEDSLEQSMFHIGRSLVDLLMVLADTPRVWHSRSEDGRQKSIPVTMDVEPGVNPWVDGYHPDQHVKIDDGDYGVIVYTGPSFDTKRDEESAELVEVFKANPQLVPLFLDVYFEKRGWDDLAERARFALPPAIQQAMAAKNGPNPQMMAQQATQLQAENAQLKGILQRVQQVLQTKQIETQGKIAVEHAKGERELTMEKLKLIGDLLKQQHQHSHEAASQMADHKVGAAEHMTQLLHDTELALRPQPMQPGQPQGAPVQ